MFYAEASRDPVMFDHRRRNGFLQDIPHFTSYKFPSCYLCSAPAPAGACWNYHFRTFQPLRYHPVCPQPTYRSGTLLHYMIIFCKQSSTFVNGKVANPKNMAGDTAASNIFSRKTKQMYTFWKLLFFPNSVPSTRETMRVSYPSKLRNCRRSFGTNA